MKVDFLSTLVPRVPTNLRLLTLTALLLGFALRLYRLGAESLWYDETVSVALAQKSIPDLIRHTAGDIHPPGYYLLLHFWQALTHPSPAFGLEFLYAWPSLVCGVLVMALLFTIGRALSTQQIALIALWLAAINPYHIWYSQEVRMYTLGALLGLLCLWAMLQWWQCLFLTMRSKNHWLVVYVLAGAMGLYTLYYFLFTLIALNFITLLLWLNQYSKTAPSVARQGSTDPCVGGRDLSIPAERAEDEISRQVDSERYPSTQRPLVHWIGAQVAIALLWSPWLPVFWRQATFPPVPPWRTPWESGTQLLAAVGESASALISGQSTPAATVGYWLLLLGLILLVAYLYYAKKNRGVTVQCNAYFILLSYLLIPIFALYGITAVATPIYHVRYLFIYAPPILLLIGAALLYLMERQQILGIGMVGLFVTLNGWSLFNFWFTPAFQTDDHRAAVAHVATDWRPGDAILVNAGWVYTALTTYWPTELVGVDAATPPALTRVTRLVDYRATQQTGQGDPVDLIHPTVVRTGSVDGAASLGWGDPASDFFAISANSTHQALFALAKTYNRLWHYRLYDTVNDPTGVIRTWLDTDNRRLAETPIPGRDFLRLQLYQRMQRPASLQNLPQLALPQAYFAGDLQLEQAALIAPTVAAGDYLYTRLLWQAPLDHTQLPLVIGFSLRLYTAEGHLLAQADETPLPLLAWPSDYPFTLALPVPIATPPGAHSLVLVVYDAQNGEPLVVLGNATGARDLPLGMVQVTPATRVPVITAVQASFDYIDLVRAHLATPKVVTGAALAVELVWRPRPNVYRDTYLGQLFLYNAEGVVVGQWEAALGGWNYPSGTWPALIPVRDWRTLPLDPAIPPGQYTLRLRVERANDHQPIPARRAWWRGGDEWVVVGTVQIE